MENYFHIDLARKTCVTADLNLRTESQNNGNLRHFREKIRYGLQEHRNVGLVLLCQENRYMFVDFFSRIRREGMRNEP